MSNAVFPSLPGLLIDVGRHVLAPPVKVRTSPARREFRARDATLPLYRYTLKYEFLRAGAQAELQSLVGFFNSRGGAFDDFLFTDPVDNTVTDQSFGVGNGSTTVFQLVRSFGGYAEPISAVNAVVNVKVNGVATGAYTISNGVLTFTTAPAAAATLTWSGTYYRRVRFEEDQAQFERFMALLWSAKQINLLSVKG